MKSFVAGLTLLLSLAAVNGCVDPTGTTNAAPNGPAFTLADAAHGHGSGFYWRPPMVKQSNSSGEFDPDANPTVEICRLENGACAEHVATFTTLSGPGSETVRNDG